MNRLEIRATLGMALVAALRMLGMFMILPVFAPYASRLPVPASPKQIWLAIGLYGLMQACLQIPLGLLSDRIGRKPVLVGGLLMFALGSFVAGASDNIQLILLGRTLQGLGAVSSAASALLADLTREHVRPIAMTILGIGIGVAFLGALVAGPAIAGVVGVRGIFTGTGVGALLAIPMVLWLVPPAPAPVMSNAGFFTVLKQRPLLALDGGVLLLHALLSALFVVLPFALESTFTLPLAQHWKIYLPTLLVALLFAFPLMRRAEKGGWGPLLFRSAIACLVLAMLLLAGGYHHGGLLAAALATFFAAFNILEGSLPSQVARLAPPGLRGAAMGVYGSCQFIGPFVGSYVAVAVKTQAGLDWAFAVLALLPLGWALAYTLPGLWAANKPSAAA